ncbi:hypothetical protein P2H44_11635 [Albimonas sp. CAU 1670]|uniref:hypothetical protein n=1 Tax=Albimonas sp. CAU 1670 TaxID=3032599 RepID=UPI0023DC8871|nr:hypothetical protein [Albimonas sp. CAU 1670]MDF2233204.1 hypothetical protein [Albimonas sp. CAU 1670]
MKIFISHASRNASYGHALVSLLTGVGVAREEIVFTSDVSCGVPLGENIFRWLKSQIVDKPFVIFLLSRDYCQSIACLNEMGAAWVVESQHAAIFTPSFDLDDSKFRNGALDPRELGFYINDEDRVTEFIESLRGNFEITSNQVAVNQRRREFLDKISALERQDGIASEGRVGGIVSPQEPTERNGSSSTELYVPSASSDLTDFRRQFLAGLFHEDEEHSSRVSQAYLATLSLEDRDAIGEWKSFCELFKLTWGKHGDLAKLAALINEHENNPLIHERVASGYLHFGDVKKAQCHFRAAIDHSNDRSRKIALLGELALAAQTEGCCKDIHPIIVEMRELVDGPETEETLLATIAKFSDWHRDDALKAAMLERQLSIDPTDISKRFQLAYLHSQIGNEALAMFHYEKIPANLRDGTTWNNLGVAYRHFSLFEKSISAYRAAAGRGETLAMSNLANEYIRAGFLSEAGEILKEAQKHQDCHSNVASALVRLNEVPEEEAKTHKENLKGVKPKSEFLSYVGQHLWLNTPGTVSRKMSDADCELEVTVEGEKFFASGEFNRSEDAIVNALMGVSRQPKAETYRVEYKGCLVGRVAIGERLKHKDNDHPGASSILSISAAAQKFIIVFADGATNLRGMVGSDLLEFRLHE